MNTQPAFPAPATAAPPPASPAVREEQPQGKPRSMGWRALRVLGGAFGAALLLLVFVNWVLVPIVWPRTGEAWLQAPLTVIRSESEGNVEVLRGVGDPVEPGDAVALLANAEVDPARQARLKTEVAGGKAEQKRRRRDLQVANNLDRLSRQELEDYRRALVKILTASLQEATAKVDEATVLHQQSKRVLEMSLRSGTGISRDDLARAAEAERIGRARLDQARASQEGIATELDATERGVFVQRDSPIQLTMSIQLRQSVAQGEAQLAETEERLAATEAELNEVEGRDRRLSGRTMRSPVAGVVWRRNASAGPVAKGESLIEVAQTRNQFIEALFPEGHARSLYPGARALIAFSGMVPLRGTVRAVRQPSPTDHDWAYAIRLPRRLNQLQVTIDLDEPPDDGSLLGRPCQVLVADEANAVDRWVGKLFCFLRW